jgi:hypothetical protein
MIVRPCRSTPEESSESSRLRRAFRPNRAIAIRWRPSLLAQASPARQIVYRTEGKPELTKTEKRHHRQEWEVRQIRA